MPITEAQREKRKRYLGSSDAAAVLGLDPYRSPTDVYYDKTDQLEAAAYQTDNDAIEVGNWCENAVLAWFADKMGLNLIRNQRRVHENKIMAANFDALVKDDPTQAVEAKTYAIISMYVSEEWGEVETDQVPERIALQCYHQMAIVPTLQTIWIPVLMGGVGLRYYRLERNSDIIKDLEDAEVAFWNDHVVAGVRPEELPTMPFIKKLRRQPNKTVDVDSALMLDWLDAKDRLKEAQSVKDQAERTLLSALNDAEAAQSTLGTATYYKQFRKSFTVKESEFRVLRFKMAK